MKLIRANKEGLTKIAINAEECLKEFYPHYANPNDRCGACGIAAVEVARACWYYMLPASIVYYNTRHSSRGKTVGHCVVECRGWIVDLSAAQFEKHAGKPFYIGRRLPTPRYGEPIYIDGPLATRKFFWEWPSDQRHVRIRSRMS